MASGTAATRRRSGNRAATWPTTRPTHRRKAGPHTAVALMIAEGAHLLATKERLCHSTIQVTADRYGHLFPSIEEALTGRLDSTHRPAGRRFHEARGDAM